ncbi:pirin family protein [Rhizobium sp. P28RR-XV]|uniref:pirin family protein n=1 Tax=Rhizobium sp. P28RR-XV TaxID=2726737 RepID=UPI0014571F0E|nr:pirin family protein [Rhizobium sp. P28RR-XV]NLR88396.1 pimeloyl-CoA dehydrogenase [Rhizobium sp. P28RR-XV]
MSQPVKLDRSMKRRHGSGGFGIEILWPGLVDRENGDSGIGAIGRIDHAQVLPGTVVSMHPHKDDEILTYLRGGRVLHLDTVGRSEQLSNTRLMLMNAGHTFQHEEQVQVDGGALQGLQIFVRPREADLEPMVQFHDFAIAYSENDWRLIAGPENAPLIFRAEAWIHDMRLDPGMAAELPSAPEGDIQRLIYVFSGKASVGDIGLSTGESLLVAADELTIVADQQTDLVLFTTNRAAPTFKAGMFSGNVLDRR